MTSEDPHHDLGELLRARKPEIPVPPGMESRIMRALERQDPPAASHWWRWLLIPPALAMGVALLWPKTSPPPPSSSIVRKETPAVPPIAAPTANPSGASSVYEANPLLTESRALSRDAKRTGRFLLDCLPSVSSVANR